MHAVAATLEQRDPELVFEAADPPRQRRLTDVESPGGSTDVSLLGDGDEGLQLEQGHETR